jgi:hypothetical protein
VKLVGPIARTVDVPNREARTLQQVAPGRYYILVRYGRGSRICSRRKSHPQYPGAVRARIKDYSKSYGELQIRIGDALSQEVVFRLSEQIKARLPPDCQAGLDLQSQVRQGAVLLRSPYEAARREYRLRVREVEAAIGGRAEAPTTGLSGGQAAFVEPRPE